MEKTMGLSQSLQQRIQGQDSNREHSKRMISQKRRNKSRDLIELNKKILRTPMQVISNKLTEEYNTNEKSPVHNKPSSKDGGEKYFSSKNSPSKMLKKKNSEFSSHSSSPHSSDGLNRDLKG